ncbi:MAG: hypothetical protein ACI30M_02670 [Muribaculaceae bacterium]
MRKIIILMLLCIIALGALAQRVSRNYQQMSLSDVLKDLSSASSKYSVNFIYDELEDFTVTTQLQGVTIPEAVYKVIGFYPIRVKEDSTAIFVECVKKIEHKFSGRVVNDKGLPLEYANIALLSPSDSTFITGGVSNLNGDFVIPCKQTDVLAKVSFVGYATAIHHLHGSDVGNIVMKPTSYNLNTVTVEGFRRTDYVDHSVYTFTDEQVKMSRQSCDLLATLPGLYLDAATGCIVRLSGGGVKLLINGVESSEKELQLIPANKVKKVEYYHYAPTKYADADDTVINVITYRLDDGYAFDTGVQSAFTTGFINSWAGARYNCGNNQLAFSWSMNLRDYDDWEGTDHYRFNRLDGTVADYSYYENQPFGYTDNNFSLKYTNANENGRVIQVEFSPRLSHNFSNSTTRIEARGEDRWQSGIGKQDSETNIFRPTIDFYFSSPMRGNQEISVNVVATHFNNSQYTSNLQMSDTSQSGDAEEVLLDDRVDQSNKKYSIIGDVSYSKRWNGNYSFDVRLLSTYGSSTSTLSNMLSGYQDYSYHSENTYTALFADFIGSLWDFNYRIGAKLVHVYNSNDDASESTLQGSPRLIISRQLGKHNYLRLNLQSWATSPSINQLSTNTTQQIPGLLSQGNPWLKASQVYSAGVSHSYQNNKFSFEEWTSLQYSTRPINRYYSWQTIDGEDYIVGSWENAKGQLAWIISGSVYYRPFGCEMLTLGISLQSGFVHINSDLTGSRTKWTSRPDYIVSFRKGDFGATYRGRLGGWYIDGAYMSKSENQSEMQAFWQHGNVRVTASCLWLFTRSKYGMELLPNPILERQEYHQINDNASMFTLGFTWNFFSGKRLNIKKKLNNRDNDSGLL